MKLDVPDDDPQIVRRLGWRLLIALSVLYALLENPYWVRYGDGELYLSVARSLVQGRGFKFNTQPIAIIPPLWPWMLAEVMRVTTSLLVIKSISAIAIVGFLMISYLVLLEFTPPKTAALCVLLVGLLQPLTFLSYVPFSDGMFCLLAMSGVWLALRIARGRNIVQGIILLPLVCIAAVGVRWAGAPWLLLIVAAALDGQRLNFKITAGKVAALLASACTVGAFCYFRHWVSVDPNTIDPRFSDFGGHGYDFIDNTGNYGQRFLNFGLWHGGLLWQAVVWVKSTRRIFNVAGWILLICTIIYAWRSFRTARYLPLAAVAYLLVLGIAWPAPMPRYIVPAAPLLMLAAIEGLRCLEPRWPRWLMLPRLKLVGSFVLSVVLINGVAYLSDMATQRLPRFYQHYQAGVHRGMIAAADYFNHLPDKDVSIAVDCNWQNFGANYNTDGYRRAMYFLTDRPMMNADPYYCREPNDAVNRYLRENHIDYFMFQPPIYLLGNFEFNPKDIKPEDVDWRLYQMVDGQARRVPLDMNTPGPTHVPGL